MKREIIYHYRGHVERGGVTVRGYYWRDGYSRDGDNGGILFPWNTKAECRKEARAIGGRAVFYRDGEREA